MAKLAILGLFDQIAQPLEGARTQNCARSISYGIWGHISRPLFQIQKFLFFIPPYSVVFEFKDKNQSKSKFKSA